MSKNYGYNDDKKNKIEIIADGALNFLELKESKKIIQNFEKEIIFMIIASLSKTWKSRIGRK